MPETKDPEFHWWKKTQSENFDQYKLREGISFKEGGYLEKLNLKSDKDTIIRELSSPANWLVNKRLAYSKTISKIYWREIGKTDIIPHILVFAVFFGDGTIWDATFGMGHEKVGSNCEEQYEPCKNEFNNFCITAQPPA